MAGLADPAFETLPGEHSEVALRVTTYDSHFCDRTLGYGGHSKEKNSSPSSMID